MSKSLYSQQGPFLLMFYNSHKTWLTSINWSPRENTSASKYQIKNRSGHFLHCFYFYKLRTNLLALSPFQVQGLTTRCQTEQTALCFTKEPIKSPLCVGSLHLPGQNSPSTRQQPHRQILYTSCFSQLNTVNLITTKNETGSFGGNIIGKRWFSSSFQAIEHTILEVETDLCSTTSFASQDYMFPEHKMQKRKKITNFITPQTSYGCTPASF